MRTACLVLAALLASLPARAEQLPLKAYGTTDGLPSTFVLQITQDSRGLLWFATRDGLARFDGSRFINYGRELGLPVPTINHVLGDGYANRVNLLFEDRTGRLWACSDAGVFVLERPWTDPEFRPVALPLMGSVTAPIGVRAFLEDDDGGLWIGTVPGLFRRRLYGGFVHYPLAKPDPRWLHALRPHRRPAARGGPFAVPGPGGRPVRGQRRLGPEPIRRRRVLVGTAAAAGGDGGLGLGHRLARPGGQLVAPDRRWSRTAAPGEAAGGAGEPVAGGALWVPNRPAPPDRDPVVRGPPR